MNKEYHKRDWSKYDKALVQRGSITLWISQEAISLWFSNKPKKKGRQEKYSDIAIETMLIVKAVFKLDNGRTEGFIKSIFDILKLDLPIPDHTTISRRGRKLNIQRNCVSSRLDKMRRVGLLIWCKVLSIMDMLYVAKSYAC